MFKLIVVVFAALFAIAAARPSHLVASPIVYSARYVQPVARAHYAVPVLRTVGHSRVVHSHVVHSPVVHSSIVHVPVAHSVPVVHSAPVLRAAPVYHSVPVVKSYGHIYVPYKNKV